MSIPSIRAYNTSTRNQRPWLFNNTTAKWRGPKLRLAYWPIKGRAEPIRMLLEFLNLPYDDYKYPFKSTNPITGKAFQVRDEGIRGDTTMAFPNTPSLTDFKGQHFTECEAIYQYLVQVSHQHDDSIPSLLAGHTQSDLLQVHGHVGDVFGSLFGALMSQGDGPHIDEMLKKGGDFTRKLGYLSEYMGKNEFLNGHLSWVDLVNFGKFSLLTILRPKYLEQFPNLHSLVGKVAALPRIKEYLASDGFKNTPAFPGFSKWHPEKK
jgi:glutathione S-transferase